MKRLIMLLLSLMILAFVPACDNGSSNGPKIIGPNPIVRPLDNAEAEMAAVWLSGELTAPQYLYTRLRDDLSEIRSEWGDSIGMVDSVYYHAYSEIGTIIIGFDSATFESVLAGTYSGWDSLNAALNIDTITFQSWGHSVTLRFKGRLNPVLLVDLYAGMPGAKWIETNSLAGDGPMVTMLREGDEIKYFLRNAWGDCLSGCIHSHIAYFTSRDDSIKFVGEHGPYFESSSVDWPLWMDTFAIAFHNWHQYNHWEDTIGHDVTPCDSLFDIPDLSEYRPYPNEEAEIAALVMSEELVAPLRLTHRIENDLRVFRAVYGDSVEAVNIGYRAPWQPSSFTLKFEPGLLTDSLHPGFDLFTCLNEKLRMTRLGSTLFDWYRIRFEGRLNSNIIAEMYTHVPGMKRIYVSGFAGDGSDIYIAGDSSEMKYFFRDAWGDCPSGCMYQVYHYYNSKNGNYRYVGTWNPITMVIPPVWADSIYMARRQKFQYFHWPTADSVSVFTNEGWMGN